MATGKAIRILKKYILPSIPYLLIFWFCLKLGTAHRWAGGATFGIKLIGMTQTLGPALKIISPGFILSDWLVGAAGAGIIRLIVYFKTKKAQKFRKDKEYGTARWGAYYQLYQIYMDDRRLPHEPV